MFVDLKVILDRQPLQIGLGRLPDWLRNKHEVISLDTYSDNPCLFRCIAVHRGANKQFNTHRARELAQSFFATYRKLTAITSQQFELLEKHFKQGIAAYSVTNAGDFILIHQPSHYDKVSHPMMHMGIYENHAFLIKDINKVLNNFTCGECMARFTRADNLKRHAPRCTSGRTDVECPGNKILASETKLLGNSAYGKFIEVVERQTKVLYTKDEDEVDKHLRSAYFEDLVEIGDAYKIESCKKEVKINRPFQVGIVVYQLAKLRMLQFYYDFLDKYIDRRDYELIQMDTDSMYFALSYDTLEEAVKPELLKEFENNKKQWLSWDKWSNRESGLFKLKKEGRRAIPLCSKCYFVDDENSAKTKMSSKGVSQKQNMPPPKPNLSLKLKQEHNEQLWRRYERALDGYKDMATNRGFRMKDGVMYTYEQHKLGLSVYYDKRWVLEDGIHTEPIEFHTPN